MKNQMKFRRRMLVLSRLFIRHSINLIKENYHELSKGTIKTNQPGLKSFT